MMIVKLSTQAYLIITGMILELIGLITNIRQGESIWGGVVEWGLDLRIWLRG